MSTNKPINDIIRIAKRDANLPSTGKANKQIPNFNLRDLGYDDNQFASAEELNYTFDNMGQWLAYFDKRVDELQKTTEDLEAQIEKERVSVGEIIEITGDSTNPSVLKGYGTWVSFGEGQVLVGVGSHTDDRSEAKTWSDGQSEGEYNHVQQVNELATHSHNVTTNPVPDHVHNQMVTAANTNQAGATIGGTTANPNYISSNGTTAAAGGHTPINNCANTGSSSPMNNIQPSLAVYRWKRVS
tara:strand:+ start:14615 stop:15340 length:726 start_codon:yes stop_codon:yes gene_type:complete